MNHDWRRFVTGQAVEKVEPLIHRSWQRSKDSHIYFERVENNEILPAVKLKERRQSKEELLIAGETVLPYIYQLLQESKNILLLCDNEGYVLETLGNPQFMSKAQQVSLSAGANWREDIKGTNAIGTSLTENAPVKVFGWEHFVQENHFLACWAAPIRNISGDVIGVLDISGDAGNDRKNNRLLKVAMMGAKMIEQNLELYNLQRNFKFTQQRIKLVSQMLREGVIAIDRFGVITDINQAGAQMLGRKPEEIIGYLASDVFKGTKGWFFKDKTLDIQLKEDTGINITSRLKPVLDENGKPLGAVGILRQTANFESANSFWVGSSKLTREVFERAAKAASTNSAVIINGESGTGKEVIARYIHQLSNRSNGPFIALNCASLPQTLVESELFGYAEGAFTGAKRGGHPGKFELAQGGTIFLDEIGDMPLNIQVSLLRVLQEKEITRIGDTKPRKIDVRVIAATHKDLPELISKNLFRLDLYYRLKVISLQAPPLRNRLDDIYDLVPYFILKACHSLGKPPLDIKQDVYKNLIAYHWPGNIRELENCIESMVAMSEGSMLTIEDLPIELKEVSPIQEPSLQLPLLDQQTKKAILDALNQTKGKIAPAAKLLGIGRNTLYRKIKEFNITYSS